ncbi:rap guanine nucleotide exchange factor 4-like isoform X2 [Paramacrobiotus metropolitanus]|uniref:rap guanine nucleotide exchange factor 4-like isoform X2 n=1 Tax=Paramacrobiotus metropolitanus TaxID=2943436 RepID=UPI002445992E|nr:rap guanine nucleotide exchange factor 4-like isoform X2 [Paramacrobiotus metropolitanus]
MYFMALGGNEWFTTLDKRPADRSQGDIAQILIQLQQEAHPLQRLHPRLLQYLSQYGIYEAVEKNITLFRQGEYTKNWYAVLEGRLRVIKGGQNYVVGRGSVFEEITGYDNIRKLTVVTKDFCQLIRLESKHMKMFCKSHPYQLKDVVETTGLDLDQIERPSDTEEILAPPRITVDHLDRNNQDAIGDNQDNAGNENHEDGVDTGLLDEEPVKPRWPPLTEAQSALLLTSLMDSYPDYVSQKLGRKHCVTAEHLMHYIAEVTQSQSTKETLGICQVLLEDGVIKPLDRKTEFADFQTEANFVYFFDKVSPLDEIDEDELQSLLDDLIRRGNDALFRMMLRRQPGSRSEQELGFIFNELVHIKALAQTSTSIKRELAKVVLLESHSSAGTVLFNQGDEGTSWYIILKGSVNVVIYGKGVVCTLHEGDDFGKLALINDAPRAASIILREPCHFLRVDKEDFNRILRDVEANTVRLKEHGKDVLILEKIPSKSKKEKSVRYSVMAGTAEQTLEYMLDTRTFENETEEEHVPGRDDLLEDYLLTHTMFISVEDLCACLLRYYNSRPRQTNSSDASAVKNRMSLNKRQVIQFVNFWNQVDREVMFQSVTVRDFLKTLCEAVDKDSHQYNLDKAWNVMEDILDNCTKYVEGLNQNSKLNISSDGTKSSEDNLRPIRPSDESVIKVYNADATYSTVRVSADMRASVVLKAAAKKLQIEGNVVLVEMKSNGEYSLFKDEEMSVETKLSVNGRLFCVPKESLAQLNPLPEQQGPNEPTGKLLETVTSKELAYHCTLYDWQLFRNIHETELINHILGRSTGITSNLDRLLVRFNQIQFWVSSEMCLTSSQSKRVHLLKKFIKAAAHCKEYFNLFAFSAIVMGLTNTAVSRLKGTWEKLPSKFAKIFKDFEEIIDPSRNHRASRMLLSNCLDERRKNTTTDPAPVIPFMPLIMKDLTFTHEGNKTLLDDLVNFEKMHMIAECLRQIRNCMTGEMEIVLPSSEKPVTEFNVQNYIRNLKVIDNQRRLMQLSYKREQKKY